MFNLSHVRVDWDGEIAVVTIDREEKLNALNADVVREIGEVFENLRDDASVRAVVVTGAGERAFVAGADIAELARMDALSGVATSSVGQAVFDRVERMPKPVIAAVGGYALGGGCELALACHLRVASEDARFGLPEVGLGLIPGFGGTVRLPRIVGLGRALEMALTGGLVDARRALEIGLVSQVVPRADLLEAAKTLARKTARHAPLALRMALESIYRSLDAPSRDALAYESAAFGLLAATRDMKEGTQAFLEKRKPSFEGR